MRWGYDHRRAMRGAPAAAARVAEADFDGLCSMSKTPLGGLRLRGPVPSSQNVLRDGLLTPGGSEGVPNDLRILHDMTPLLQENKIRKRQVSISTLPDTPNRMSFSRAPPPWESLRHFPRLLLCQIMLTRAQRNHFGGFDENGNLKVKSWNKR